MAKAYDAPLNLMRLAIDQAVESTRLTRFEAMNEALGDVADAVLENAARFARDVLSPLNTIGDRSPSRCGPEGVTTPPGFAEAYRRFREDGWPSLGVPAELGGQGLPMVVAAAATEMWAGANMAFAMCPEVVVGALEALGVHASAELRERYVPGLVGGESTAAMCLTEPQAGSDLAALRTRAEPDGAAWRLYGRKIYISWGDHDFTDNIVHLVLARTPDAPPGLKGISLFLVPKKIPDDSGVLASNDIHAVSLEHKMGIRASPTCVMVLGEHTGARGWLVGRLHEGMSCMFTMINHMRLGVGLHSLGLAERASQLARDYARERRQGHGEGNTQRPIIEHADVRRMLLMMKALTHASRCLIYTTAATLDAARAASDESERAAALQRVELLTPVVKAWCSEVAVEVASLGVQVHGGLGYVDDAEISQVYRDARIGPIFEGTNYIQAHDLVGRKVVRDAGAALGRLLDEIDAAAHALPSDESHVLIDLRTWLSEGCERMREAASYLAHSAASEPDVIGATAHHFLQWLGVLVGGWQWAIAANRALERSERDSSARAMIDTAVFYAAHVLPRMHAHETAVRQGPGPVTAPDLAFL